MMSLDETWKELEVAGQHIEARRRVHPEAVADLWLVVFGDSGRRALRVGTGGSVSDVRPPDDSGIQLRTRELDGQNVLEVVLVATEFEDLFDALVDDIIERILPMQSVDEVVVCVADRIRKWQSFLQTRNEGLSRERQRGLFGEIHVLQCLAQLLGPGRALGGWVGPSGAPQDFSVGGVAVEVKTSSGKNPQRLRITSERQLDDSNLAGLVLWHVSTDERVGVGSTLPEIVALTRMEMAKSGLVHLFEDGLLQAGYHTIHASRYVTGYSLRDEHRFLVAPGFPRIVESDCPSGLGDVKYSIELGALTDFVVDDTQFGSLVEVAGVE